MAIYGKGIYEKGKHKSKIGNKHTKEYLVWRTMISRCYNPRYLEKHPTYGKCEVCEEWLYFQNFCEWFDKNYYEIKDETVDLDKDFLSIMNNNSLKIYSPNTCMFIPQKINKSITFQRNKTHDTPTGVKTTKNKNIFSVSRCNKSTNSNNRETYIGRFKNKEDAFEAYISSKEKYIKNTLNKYKDKIPSNVYNSMVKFIEGNYLKDIYNY